MISIIIPLYNKEHCIQTTIESVLKQNFQDFELFVVDDGSTDGSADVVMGFDDNRIKLIQKENGGVCSARNVGIREAGYEYVAFLDADDLWEPEFLSEISKMIHDFPDAGILGTSYFYLGKGTKESAGKPLSKDFYGIIDNSKWNLAHIYCSTAVCCKKSALNEVGLFDERIAYGEDIDVWWRIMLNHPAAFSNKELAIYRLDEENRAMNKEIPLDKLYINYFEKYAEYRKANDCFRHFIDKECMWWLFPYYLKDRQNKNIKRILSQIDLNEYKPSFKFRFMFPHLYHLIKRLK